MKKTTTIRRIIGITALVLWVMAIVPQFFLGYNDRIFWRLDQWALWFAPVLTLVYAVMRTIYISKCKHWAVKILEWLGCTFIILLCLATFFWAGVLREYKVWGDKDYVVYSEWGGFADPDVYVLYKRNGILDRRLHILDFKDYDNPPFVLGDVNLGGIKSAEYSIYEDLNLIRCEAEVRSCMKEDSLYHATVFYQFDNGRRYNESKNDSLFTLIK